MKAKTTFSMEKKGGYGQYNVIKTTPTRIVTKHHTTDSQAWDDFTEGKCSQARLKRIFN